MSFGRLRMLQKGGDGRVTIKQIALAEAMNTIYQGGMAYMVIPIDADTTVGMLNKAEAYCVVIDDIEATAPKEAPNLEEYTEIEPEAEPDPEPEKTVKKSAQTETKKSIDHGKICALYKAGWTCTAIAEEMKCNAQTVINHLVKEGIYRKRGE